jgi:hypothetical protein
MIFRKTAREIVLEQEVNVLKAKLAFLEAHNKEAFKYTTFENPETITFPAVVPPTITLAKYTSLKATPTIDGGYHVMAKAHTPQEIAYGYYVSENLLTYGASISQKVDLLDTLHQAFVDGLAKTFLQ